MVINSPCYYNEELASPQQTAHGKDISNPLIADSLLKTMVRAVTLKIFSFHCSLSVKSFYHCQFTVTTASAIFTTGELAVGTVVSVTNFYQPLSFNRFSRGLFWRIIYLTNLYLSPIFTYSVTLDNFSHDFLSNPSRPKRKTQLALKLKQFHSFLSIKHLTRWNLLMNTIRLHTWRNQM